MEVHWTEQIQARTVHVPMRPTLQYIEGLQKGSFVLSISVQWQHCSKTKLKRREKTDQRRGKGGGVLKGKGASQ